MELRAISSQRSRRQSFMMSFNPLRHSIYSQRGSKGQNLSVVNLLHQVLPFEFLQCFRITIFLPINSRSERSHLQVLGNQQHNLLLPNCTLYYIHLHFTKRLETLDSIKGPSNTRQRNTRLCLNEINTRKSLVKGERFIRSVFFSATSSLPFRFWGL